MRTMPAGVPVSLSHSRSREVRGMSARNIVVIGASSGGIEALQQLLPQLPASYAGTLAVVLHTSADYPSVLPKILNRHSLLPVAHAIDGEALRPSHIYIAPPDHHLLLQECVMRLSRSPKENYSRPAVDPLFRSAAETYGEQVVGVVLSGNLYDGTAGLMTIKHYGGVTIVQDPSEAQYPSMPQSAVSRSSPDYVLPLSEIAKALVRLAR